MGDFNADLIEPNAETRVLLNFIDRHTLKVVEHGATHHTRTTTTTSDTHIDLVLVDAHDRLLISINSLCLFLSFSRTHVALHIAFALLLL